MVIISSIDTNTFVSIIISIRYIISPGMITLNSSQAASHQYLVGVCKYHNYVHQLDISLSGRFCELGTTIPVHLCEAAYVTHIVEFMAYNIPDTDNNRHKCVCICRRNHNLNHIYILFF